MGNNKIRSTGIFAAHRLGVRRREGSVYPAQELFRKAIAGLSGRSDGATAGGGGRSSAPCEEVRQRINPQFGRMTGEGVREFSA